VSFGAITLCVASQRVFFVVVFHFVIDSVRKLLNTTSLLQTVIEGPERPRQRKMNMKFSTWRAEGLHRGGSVKTVTSELA
jgi:hypothetical protein